MLSNSEKRCTQGVSKTSEMLDLIQYFSAQAVSRMSKMTKMYFVKKFLNQTPKNTGQTVLHGGCPKWKDGE